MRVQLPNKSTPCSLGLSLLDCMLGTLVLSCLVYLSVSLASQELRRQNDTLGELQRIAAEQQQRTSCTQQQGFVLCENTFGEEIIYIYESLQPS